jgi:hypothetical protein
MVRAMAGVSVEVGLGQGLGLGLGFMTMNVTSKMRRCETLTRPEVEDEPVPSQP